MVAELCARDPRFALVKAITTRPPRADDEEKAFECVSEAHFHELVQRSELLVDGSYRGHHYGIRRSDLAAVELANQIPTLIITPQAADRLDGIRCDNRRLTQLPQFLSVFVDAPDGLLEDRLNLRGQPIDARSVLEQRKRDREYKYSFLYSVENIHLNSLVELVLSLWNRSDSGGVLSARLIHLMIECGTLLENASSNNVSGASYDLSLGDEYFYGGRVRRLSDSDPILLIEPYDYAIVTSREVSNLALDVCGRFDLAVSLFSQGVILSNGPQIDPGFRGPLFCLLFNTSSSPVLLKREQHYATLEFHKLVEPTYPYGGQYQAKDLLDYLPSNAARGAINELKKELDQVRGESRNLQSITLAILTLVVAIIAIFASAQ